MTNQEYIDTHPEQFKDEIDKWLFNEFGIMGGCCSAQGSLTYSTARMVAEKMQEQIVDKLKALIQQWSNGDSTEAKYKAEAYKDSLEIFMEE